MGGVPVLLLLAAMGITYGWQPDGNGGVEYVIQIPPDQLDELQRGGDLTSVIHPKIQGHVSRVIVKVGDETLQEITPKDLNRSARLTQGAIVPALAYDHSPVPVPEIHTGPESRTEVMKPAGGFELPPTLNDAATRAAGNLRTGADQFAAELDRRAKEGTAAGIDQARAAANGLKDRAGNALRNAADTVFGRGDNSITQPPNLTGANSTQALARSRQGAPSTEPTGQRDQNWYGPDGRLRRPTTEPVGNQRHPRDLVGPPDLRPSTLRGSSTAVPNATSYADQLARTNQERARAEQARLEQSRLDQARAEQARREQVRLAEQERARLASQNRSEGFGTTTNFASPPIEMRSNAVDPRYASNTNTLPRGSEEPSFGSSFAAPNSGGRIDVDPRLTADQVAKLPTGGWSFDAYGRPIDREGRLLDQWGRLVNSTTAFNGNQPASGPGLPAGYDAARGVPDHNAPSTSYPGLGYANGYNRGADPSGQPPRPSTDPSRTLASTNVYPPAATRPQAVTTLQHPQAVRPNGQATVAAPNQAALQSAGERSVASASDLETSAAIARTRANATAPREEPKGPLFNILLLVSVVGNIYLFFWLKNMRYRFRDLVAAKRVVSSTSSAA